MPLTAIAPGRYRGTFVVRQGAPAGVFAVQAWIGGTANPIAIGKAIFLHGKIVGDVFMPGSLDSIHPRHDLARYLGDWRKLGGNLLIAHGLITPGKAYYPSKICKTDIPSGSPRDLVESLLRAADAAGIAVLLSASWDLTQNVPYPERTKSTEAIMKELYALYGHHPSMIGFYAYQEGSGTYYLPFIREFCRYAKKLNSGLLTACAPYVDDPLLAGYLGTINDLDMLIYQGMVMASYRPDNRKKYPIRRVRDFCSLGVGAKLLQGKIALDHVELFGYLEQSVNHMYLTNEHNIYGQLLSAATVAGNDGALLFAYQPVIYEPLKRSSKAEASRRAVFDGMKAFQVIAKASRQSNQLAVYFPYSDWVVERWADDYLPALDAFRALGIPVDILPYAPPLSESYLPYYPFHANPGVLRRLRESRTALILPNVSGFQHTDSDLIRKYLEQGGVVFAFGPQIPMGTSYEREALFGGQERRKRPHSAIIVHSALGMRAAVGSRWNLGRVEFPSWRATRAKVIATFEDGSAAVVMNRYGKGTAAVILPDVLTAAERFPGLVRDVIDAALATANLKRPVDILGTDINTDSAVARTAQGFRCAIVNHDGEPLAVTLWSLEEAHAGSAEWLDLETGKEIREAGANQPLKLPIAPDGFRAVEFRRQPKR